MTRTEWEELVEVLENAVDAAVQEHAVAEKEQGRYPSRATRIALLWQDAEKAKRVRDRTKAAFAEWLED